ncbi:MAG TPA: hypothetical protein VHL09_15605 [Dehalococcoidia bacterium]|nr:hypothetical protein [Dehalococcoidia bacterium]
MGATSADTRREIEELRADTTALLVDLEGKVRHTLDVRAQIREHPAVAAGVGLGLSAGLGLIGFSIYRNVQERRTAKRRTQQLQSWMAEHWPDQLPFRVLPRDGRLDLGGLHVEKEPSMAQRLAWTLLTTGGTAIASYLARQFTESLWQRGFGEPPPAA